MRIRFLPILSVSFLLLSVPPAFSNADFYGVKMASEYSARDLTVDESGPTPNFSVDKPGMDKRIYATATLSGRNLRIQVFNQSDETIQSDADYAEYTVVTHDGERHVLKPPPMVWNPTSAIPPNKSAAFEPAFEGRALKKDEIRAIICSFDLDNLKIILLPLSKSFSEKKAPTAPAKSVVPPKKPIELKKEIPKKVEEKKPVETKKPEPKKIEVKKPEPPKVKKKSEPVPAPKKIEAVKPAPGAISAGKKAAVSSEDEKKLLDQYEKLKKSRKYWRVEEVRGGLLVINLGAGDGLKPGGSIQIARDGAFLAQAVVRSLSQNYATASVPEGSLADVKVGDDVLFFGLSENS